MDLNRKILKRGIIIIILGLIISLGIAIFMRLDKPVFLKNYSETAFSVSGDYIDEGNFTFKYITNVSDKRKVTDIKFEECPNLVFYPRGNMGFGDVFSMFSQNDYQREDSYGRYVIRNIYITIDGRYLGEYDEIELSNGKITFDNGEVMDVNLGRIKLYNYSKYRGEHFDFSSGGSSSDGTSSTEMKVKDDITLVEIDTSLLEEIEDLVEIKIGNIKYKNISGIQYRDGDLMNIYSKFQEPQDILRKFNIYDIEPKLNYKTSDERFFYRPINNIRYEKRDFNLWEIIKYLRERGEI